MHDRHVRELQVVQDAPAECFRHRHGVARGGRELEDLVADLAPACRLAGLPQGELPGAQRRQQGDVVMAPARDRHRLLAVGVASRGIGEIERACQLREQDDTPVTVARPDELDRLLEEAHEGPVDRAGLLGRGRGERERKDVGVAEVAREPRRLDQRGAGSFGVARRLLRGSEWQEDGEPRVG